MVVGVDDLKTHNMEANAKLDVLYKNKYADELPKDVHIHEITQSHVDFYFKNKVRINQEYTSNITILR